MFLTFMVTKASALSGPRPFPVVVFKQGVLLGFWQGNKLKDEDGYLAHGTNKKVFYRIYKDAEEIDEMAIVKLLKEAVKTDRKGIH